MTQDLQTMQQELTIARQEKEIMELRFKLQKTQAEKASKLEDSLFAPELFPHYQTVAEKLAKSSMIPKQYIGKPDDIFVAMAMGYQLGFSVEQSLQDVAVINGRPTLWGDGLLALCLNHPDCEDVVESPVYSGDNIIGYKCSIKRKGHDEHTQVFTMQDAEKAGLLRKQGVWQQYPARMCQMRARSLALRDKFADALRGLRIAEIEEEDAQIIDGEIIEDKKQSQTQKLKEKLQSNNGQEKKASNDAQSEAKTAAKSKRSQENKEELELALHDKKETIKELMKEKGFDKQRKEKAFKYFNVNSIDELSSEQASFFIMQLENA